MITDLNPVPVQYEPTRNQYEIYVDVHSNYEDEDDPYGPRVYAIQEPIEDKAEAIQAMNQLQELYMFIVDAESIAKITHSEIRDELMEALNEGHYQLFIGRIAIMYYDEYGRKCSVKLTEE